MRTGKNIVSLLKSITAYPPYLTTERFADCPPRHVIDVLLNAAVGGAELDVGGVHLGRVTVEEGEKVLSD